MNVLTAFAGIYEQSRPDEQDVLHLDHSQVIPHHRGLQSESIDYSGCYADLSNADENNNGFIEQQEYYTFLKSYGKRVCYSGATVTVQQKSTFYTLACLCRQIGNDGSLENQAVTDSDACCLGNNAKIYTYRDPVTLEPIPVPLLTVSQKEYVKTVCFYADASIPASARDCSTNTTDEDEGEDFPINDGDNQESSDGDEDEYEDESSDDDYGAIDKPEEDDKPKGTASCQFKSATLLEDGELTIRHYSDPIEESITVQLIYNGIGWLGFGFTDVTKPATMIHNFAVIGLPATDKVQQYDLAGKSITGVTPTPVQSLVRTSITQNADQTIMTFTQAASEIGNIYNGTFQFIYAVGRTNEFGYHTFRGSGKASHSLCAVLPPKDVETQVNATESVSLEPSLSPATKSVSSVAPTSAPSAPTATSGSIAPSRGKTTTEQVVAPIAPTPTPSKQPMLRGSGSTEEEEEEEDDGKTAKDVIEAFLNGDDIDDEPDRTTPPPKKEEEEAEETTGLESFIRWLRIIWMFAKKPVAVDDANVRR